MMRRDHALAVVCATPFVVYLTALGWYEIPKPKPEPKGDVTWLLVVPHPPAVNEYRSLDACNEAVRPLLEMRLRDSTPTDAVAMARQAAAPECIPGRFIAAAPASEVGGEGSPAPGSVVASRGTP